MSSDPARQSRLSRSKLFRVKQFFETHREESIVSPMARQLPWSHHLIIHAVNAINLVACSYFSYAPL